MSKRCHIIYAHPAGTDTYSFFYLYYFPGERQLTLKYAQNDEEAKEISLPPVAMLDLMENQASMKNLDPPNQIRAWDRGAKALRIRLRTWMQQAAQQQ
jgi:hypothetical protein